MSMPLFPFLPAIVAAVTDVVAAVVVQAYQHDLPGRFLIFEVAMFGLALLLATRHRGVWTVAFILLIGGVFLAAASAGIFYVPTVIVAGCVMARRSDISYTTSTPGFLDVKPQKGVIYTESELEAMRNRQGPARGN